MEPTTIIASAVACLAAVVSWAGAVRSWPVRMRAEIEAVKASQVRALDQLQEAEGRATKVLTKFAEIQEDVEGVLDSIERKRRRIAAHASKVNGPENAEPAPGTPERQTYLRALARQQGFNG